MLYLEILTVNVSIIKLAKTINPHGRCIYYSYRF